MFAYAGMVLDGPPRATSAAAMATVAQDRIGLESYAFRVL